MNCKTFGEHYLIGCDTGRNLLTCGRNVLPPPSGLKCNVFYWHGGTTTSNQVGYWYNVLRSWDAGTELSCPLSFTDMDIRVAIIGHSLTCNFAQRIHRFPQKRHLADHPLLLVIHFFFLMDRLLTTIKRSHFVLPSWASPKSPWELVAAFSQQQRSQQLNPAVRE
jgi:hypothetical protein